MSTKLTVAQREEAIAAAYRLSLRGTSVPKIAKSIGLPEKQTVQLLRVALDRARKQTAKSMDEARVEFEGQQQQIIEEAYRAVARLRPTRQPIAPLLNTIAQASVNIAKARGLFIERRDVTSGGESLGQILATIREPIKVINVNEDTSADGDVGSTPRPIRRALPGA